MRRTLLLLLLFAWAAPSVAQFMEPAFLRDAIKTQRRVVARNPNDPTALNDLGNLLTLAGTLEQANEAYLGALALAPEEGITHYNLGLLERQMGNRRRALASLKKAVQFAPDHALSHYQLGVLLEEKDRTKSAVHHYSRAYLLDDSLTQLSSNPQLLDSTLNTRAMLTAHNERMGRLETAPRQYGRPLRIRQLLMPLVAQPSQDEAADEAETAVTPGAEDTTEEPAPRPKRRRRRKKTDG